MEKQVTTQTLHGVVHSLGPLFYGKNSSVKRLLTIKFAGLREMQYVGAYLIGDDATNGDIRLGRPIVIKYLFTSGMERVIVGFSYEEEFQ